MQTQEIADRRRLFELFTWLLDNSKAAKEPEVGARVQCLDLVES